MAKVSEQYENAGVVCGEGCEVCSELQTGSVKRGNGWIVLTVVFMLLTAVMTFIAWHNAKLIDCVHVYPDEGKMWCISEIK